MYVAEPTILIVADAVEGLRFDAIVAHGPPSDDPTRVGLWWTRFSSIVLGRPAPCAPAVLLVDANAKVGSEESFSAGPYRADGESLAGGYLRALLEKLDLFLPQTFEQHAMPGDASTWHSKAGKGHRIDFVGLPRGWVPNPCSAGPNPGVDISGGTIDHSLVVVHCVASVVRGRKLCTRRAVVCDPEVLSRPSRAGVLRLALGFAPVLPWRVAADDVVTIATVFARVVASVIAPCKGCRKRQTWISDETLALIIQRAARRRTKDALRVAAKSISVSHEVLVSPFVDAIGAEIREMSKNIKRCTRADKQRHIENVATKASRARNDGDSRKAYSFVKELTPYRPRKPQ